MISRCPSCAAEVDDAAMRCPSCHWDFIARRRMSPDGTAAAAPPPKPVEQDKPQPAKEDPSKPAPAGSSLTFVPFSESVGLTEKRAVPREASSGLLRFPKVDPGSLSKPSDDAPFILPEQSRKPKSEPPEESPKSAFKPVLDGPPLTVRRPTEPPLPTERPEDKPRPEAEPPKPEPRPQPVAKPAPRPKPTPPKEPARPSQPFPWAALSAGLVVVAAGAAVWSGLRGDAAVEQGAGVLTRGLFERGDQRDIRRMQRAVIDPTRPEIAPSLLAGQSEGARAVPPPISSPAPIPVAPPQPEPASVPATAVATASAAASAPAGRKVVVFASSAALPPTGRAAAAQARKAPTVVLLRTPQASMPLNPPQPSREAPKVDAARSWVFEAQVYDLITLSTIYGLQVVFTHRSAAAPIEARTGPDGSLRVELPPTPDQSGYTAKIAHPDYQFYLDDTDPPLSKAAAEDRRIAATIRAANKPWKGVVGQTVKRGIVVIPKSFVPAEEP